MGATSSKIEDDKALLLCRERKRFVKQALEGRCLLASAHIAYIEALRNTGIAFMKFIEPETQGSTSATPEPLTVTVNSNSQLSNSSPSLSQHAEASEPFTPIPPSRSSGWFHVNHMKAASVPSVKIEERPPVLLTASVQTSTPLRSPESNSELNSFQVNHMNNGSTMERSSVPAEPYFEENSSSEIPPPPGTPPWDFFGLHHPFDNQFSLHDGKMLSDGFDSIDDIKRLREEKCIPELEDEGEQASNHEKIDSSVDSQDDFDQPSDESLVQIYRNRNGELDASLHKTISGSIASETEQEKGELGGLNNGVHQTEEASELKLLKTTSEVALSLNATKIELQSENSVKDFLSCIKEIQILFFKASSFGGEVTRMLEANKRHIRPLFPEETANKVTASIFPASCFTCCTEETYSSPAPARNDMKYLPWHGSMSSRSSPSRIPLGAVSNDEPEQLSSNLFDSMCMNSGSHASTLDRLYAWERKLYDEVKASGVIRREYDMKCRLLRQQDSRAESQFKIDKTRAAVKDLHSRIRVAIHRINSISKTIEELRDKELQPQLEELIGGLTRMWAMMLDCHKNQCKIISDACTMESCKESLLSEYHQQATMLLRFELSSLCSSFTKWIAAHKSYLQAINNWLLKCVLMVPKQKSMRKKHSQFSPRSDIAPPIFITCRDWLTLLNDLPIKEVKNAISELIEVVSLFLPRTENNHGNLTSIFSLSRRSKDNVHYEEIPNNETSVNSSVNYDSLQSVLVVFFHHLSSFAESSVAKYEALRKTIDEARVRYDTADIRR
ncbi:hypothetical protein AXF42_Ash008798 [Apostasia shenzhenica]|uniref:DUF632 domain-containing protein n=1 Tax=Apostasia shenzhenica TaxID=1088818 RepID=A0A2I0ASI4_9ASPA|nr:hypothetical protein AXF42_Ash008798 [Apostasia shenzhenica]